MKKTLFSMALAVSLIMGCTFAFADSAGHGEVKSQENMNAQTLKKALGEAIIVQDGKESWILHQPKENRRQYFPGTSLRRKGGKIAQCFTLTTRLIIFTHDYRFRNRKQKREKVFSLLPFYSKSIILISF